MTKAEDKLAELLAFVDSLKRTRIEGGATDWEAYKHGCNAALDTVAKKIKELEAIEGEQHT